MRGGHPVPVQSATDAVRKWEAGSRRAQVQRINQGEIRSAIRVVDGKK